MPGFAAARTVAVVVGALIVVSGCATGTGAVARGGTYSFVSPGGQTRIFYPEAERRAIPEISGEDLL